MTAIFDLMGAGALFMDFGGSSPEPEPGTDPVMTAGEQSGAGVGYANVNGFNFGSITKEPVAGSTLLMLIDTGLGQLQMAFTDDAQSAVYDKEVLLNGTRYIMFSQWQPNGAGQTIAQFEVPLADALVAGQQYIVTFSPRLVA